MGICKNSKLTSAVLLFDVPPQEPLLFSFFSLLHASLPLLNQHVSQMAANKFTPAFNECRFFIKWFEKRLTSAKQKFKADQIDKI